MLNPFSLGIRKGVNQKYKETKEDLSLYLRLKILNFESENFSNVHQKYTLIRFEIGFMGGDDGRLKFNKKF